MEITGKKGKLLKAVIAVLLAAVLGVGFFFWARYIMTKKAYHTEPVTEETLLPLGITACNKLMIVAHPDDETIWGGGHLKEGGYLVVCITNGKNKERKREFLDAVEMSGNTALILGYPDKLFGERDDWEKVDSKITDDIGFIMSYKAWDLIVTHNPDGEYGHIHHKMTSEIVTKVYDRLKPQTALYYFGQYHKAAEMPAQSDDFSPISEEQQDFKDRILECYESQKDTIEKFRHMLPYENWQEYQGR